MHPQPDDQQRVQQARRPRDQRRDAKPEGEALGAVIDLVVNGLHQHQCREQEPHHQRLHRDRQTHHRVAEYLFHRVPQQADLQRSTLGLGQGFGQAEHGPDHTGCRENDERQEYATPIGQGDDHSPHCRGKGGHHDKDHHYERHDLGHLPARIKVADHRKRHNPRARSPHALHDPRDQHHLKRLA